MLTLQAHLAREQAPLGSEPYDRWITPPDDVKCEFHRVPEGFLLRFLDEADFLILPDTRIVHGWPAPATSADHFASLFHHGVVPLFGNHAGGLFLHGSAVAIGGRAVAFLGLSRAGKTTLAGAFAKAGHPLLTEDVIELVPTADGGGYLLQPKPSKLRLFADSAGWLLGRRFSEDQQDNKQSIAGDDVLPFGDTACVLERIYLLGNDHAAALAITPLAGQAALTQLLPHSFVLDVEDKVRLRDHFCRIAKLSEQASCRALDYPRRYDELPGVIAAITADLEWAGPDNDDA